MANAQNSGNGPDRSYCYEMSLFHGQDCYISPAGRTEYHVSSKEASFLLRELDIGKWSWLEQAAGVSSTWSTETLP